MGGVMSNVPQAGQQAESVPVDELLQALMSRQASINKNVIQLLNSRRPDLTLNSGGLKPIHVALISNNIELLKSILRNEECDVNVKYEGMAPLHIACSMVSIRMVIELVKHPKININLQSAPEKVTAIMAVLASEQSGRLEEKAEIVGCLMKQKSCDVTAVDKDGWTALTYSAHFGNLPVAKLLLSDDTKSLYSTDQLVEACREGLRSGHPDISHHIVKSLSLEQKSMLKGKLDRLRFDEGTTPLVRRLIEEVAGFWDSGFIETISPSGSASDCNSQELAAGDIVLVVATVSRLRELQRVVAAQRNSHLDSAESLIGKKARIKYVDLSGSFLALDFDTNGKEGKANLRYIHPKAVKRVDLEGYEADSVLGQQAVPYVGKTKPEEQNMAQERVQTEDNRGIQEELPAGVSLPKTDDVTLKLYKSDASSSEGVQTRLPKSEDLTLSNTPTKSPKDRAMNARQISQRPRSRPVSFIPYDQLEIGKKIGKGGFGTVFRATWNFSECAVKAIRRDHPSNQEEDEEEDSDIEILKEAELHGLLSHPHVIQFLGVSVNPSDNLRLNYFIVMQCIDGPDLFDVIFDPEGTKIHLSLIQKTTIAQQICDAVRYLHDDAHIVHKDIKPHNIIVERSTRKPFITDFGISKLSEDIISQYTMSACGSLPYMAPELVTQSEASGRFRSPSNSSDIWSLGATLTELYTGRPLYGEKKPNAATMMQLKVASTYPVALGYATSQHMRFLSPVLDPVPENRPTASQLIAALKAHRLELGRASGASDV